MFFLLNPILVHSMTERSGATILHSTLDNILIQITQKRWTPCVWLLSSTLTYILSDTPARRVDAPNSSIKLLLVLFAWSLIHEFLDLKKLIY
jgi:hypothetical protein